MAISSAERDELDRAKSLRSTMDTRFKPLESRFVRESQLTPGDRRYASGRAGADTARLAKTDLDARLRGRMVGTGRNTASDVTDAAVVKAGAGSSMARRAFEGVDARQDANDAGVMEVGRSLLGDSVADASLMSRASQAEGRSRTLFEDRMGALQSDTGGYLFGRGLESYSSGGDPKDNIFKRAVSTWRDNNATREFAAQRKLFE